MVCFHLKFAFISKKLVLLETTYKNLSGGDQLLLCSNFVKCSGLHVTIQMARRVSFVWTKVTFEPLDLKVNSFNVSIHHTFLDGFEVTFRAFVGVLF